MIPAVVVTFRAPDLLKRCLASLEGQAEPYVVDNSEDETILYTRGVNKGLRANLSAKYVLVCCDDVTLMPGAVAHLTEYMDSNPTCAVTMPLQVSNGQVTCGGCLAAYPYGIHITEPLGSPLYAEPYESYWANGACFLLRTKAVTECGLLDENMRFICSDSDYSFTLRTRGWKISVVPQAHAEHEPRGAKSIANPYLERVKAEDLLYFIQKWISGGLFQRFAAEGHSLRVQDVEKRIRELQQQIAYYAK